ncbi:hypothetical protein GCM10010912_09460 [Paenibacillus albidus]|uniref:SLH domain-containing protein n=1 Tax=Paenibacillus albidus TaxID=2041023 RepID=A0A917C3P5_9BACL|nr:S8 family serine peptidase [Paenibacillus albidus]GGF66583.1 hypothetical protein GCM10010912_09460 [Paenibacillus albidus]
MEWGKLTRKLSILALSAGVTISTVPGAVSAASSVQPTFNESTIVLNQALNGTYISPDIDTQSTKDVRVIVQLSGQPAAVGKYAAKQGISSLASTATEAAVNSQQTEVLNKADKAGLDVEVNYKYNTVLNGFEITIPANEIPALAQISGVKSIYENSTWYPIPGEADTAVATEEVTPKNDNGPLEQIHADWAWTKGFTGKGLKVGVIDTGLDYTHPDIEAAYKGGYDSFYNDADPYEEVPLTETEDPYGVGYAGTYHGTHVAGTIIGQFANRSGEIAHKGVAYGADLYAYKVLGRNLKDPSTSSGSSAQVIDGIERAVKDDMDVINLSLGSDEEKDVNSPDAIAINNAVLSGVVAVIANGNAGPGYFTLGSPATSQLGISVGAVTSPSKQYSGTFSSALSVSSVTYDTYQDFDFNVMAWELANEDFASIVGTEPVDVVYAGLGSAGEYPTEDVNGAIVLLSRGQLAFTDKIAIAKEHNARAVVIFNGNAKNGEADLSPSIEGRDGFINSLLGDGFDSIPTFDIKGTEGRALARALLESADNKLQFKFGTDYNPQEDPGDALASFTSFGPNVDPEMSIKPDFTAPGVSILSTYPAYGKYDKEATYEKAYSRLNGTSMATPHVAGATLLIKEAHPAWSPFDIRSALANTADVGTAVTDDVYEPFDVYQQGAGRINIENAINTPALLQSLEPITILDKNHNPQNVINYNSSAAFGVVAPGSSKVKNLQLKNTGSEALTYTASVEWHFEDPAGITASLTSSSVTAAAGSATSFAMNLNVDAKAKKDALYEGQINLKVEGRPELPALHLPFTVYVGTELPDNGVGIQEVALTNTVIYPNRSNQQSTDLTYKLKAKDANYYHIEIVDMNDEAIGYLEAKNTGDLTKSFEPGTYTFKGFGGSYHPYGEDGAPKLDAQGKPAVEHLKDGVYKINITAAPVKVTSAPVSIDRDNDPYYTAYTSVRVDNSFESTGGGGGGGGGGGTTVTPAPTTAPAASASANAVIEQGLKQAPITAATSSADGVTTIKVTDNDLKNALATAGNAPVAVIISVPSLTDGTAQVVLTAEQVKQLTAAPAKSTVVVNVAGSAFALPVSLFSKGAADAGLTLIIRKAEDQTSKFTASVAGSKVIGTPISFEANWTTASGSTALKVPHDVFLKRSFTVPGSIEPNTAGVLFEENSKITPVASVFTKQADGSTIVTVSRPGFSVYAAVSRPVSFTDIAASKAASEITALANKLIIEGTSATTFSPKSNLTRAEFTALLSRSLGLRSTAASTFTDVKASDWYANDVAAAYEAGLILGTGKGKFAPTDKVTRQELAVILGRALKLTGVELKVANPSFSTYADDAKIFNYAKESIKSLSAAGVISSDNGSNFNPTASATREAAAAALHQLLSKAGLIN